MNRKKKKPPQPTRKAKPAQAPAPPPPAVMSWPVRPCAALMILAAVVAYFPALNGAILFDDTAWTTSLAPALKDAGGLCRMWTVPTTLQQYFPLTGTTFWLDHQLWHGWTLPYHVENLLLHLVSAFLFWRLLRLLGVPGAPGAAAVFTLHPMMAESVAWIAERKNVLSLALLLGSALAYVRFTGLADESARGKRSLWTASWLLFVAALLAKITAVALPVALLLLLWWKRGRLGWRSDFLPLLPFFLAAIPPGLLVSWLERHHVGAEGADWELSLGARTVLAGQVFWFYVLKLLWPTDLCFVYPRWQPDPAVWTQWLPVLLLMASYTLLLRWRARAGRGVVTAALLFLAALLPVLGFSNVYGTLFSFVSHRWCYIASLPLIAAVAALVSIWAQKTHLPRLPVILALTACAWLAFLTRQEARHYESNEVLWTETLKRNPQCWIGRFNLGVLETERKAPEAAIRHYRAVLELKPDYANARMNLANMLTDTGRFEEAVSEFKALLTSDLHSTEAQAEMSAALVRYNLAFALENAGQAEQAHAYYLEAIQLDPSFEPAQTHLGLLAMAAGRPEDAAPYFEKAVELAPNTPTTRNNLSVALQRIGRVVEAIDHYRQLLQTTPEDLSGLSNLAWVLATCPDESIRNGQEALALAQKAASIESSPNPIALCSLAAAQAEIGDFAHAAETAARAQQAARAQGNQPMEASMQAHRECYLRKQPIRDESLEPNSDH